MYRVVSRRGTDTVHDERTLEECNVDDATERLWLDEETARGATADGAARTCDHCLPEGLPEPLE